MKHIALRSKSVRSGDRPYTTPGLGDRVHSAMIAYQYGKAHNSPVTIHITDDKWSIAGGVPSGKKKKSWIEILALFPSDSLYLEPHPVENLTEVEFEVHRRYKNLVIRDVDHRYFYRSTQKYITCLLKNSRPGVKHYFILENNELSKHLPQKNVLIQDFPKMRNKFKKGISHVIDQNFHDVVAKLVVDKLNLN